MPTTSPRRFQSLLAITLAVGAGVFVLSFLPRAMLYPAPRLPVPEPPMPWREVRIPLADNGHVHGWWRASPDPGATLIFFHGNGESLATLGWGGLLDQLAAVSAATLVLDYPGYGRSPGRPSEAGLHAAADAALHFAEAEENSRPVVVWGWSLGAAVAIPLAARAGERVGGLIAASPWTRLRDVAAVHFPRVLVRLLLREEYHSLRAAAAVHVPALVLHGREDGIIPPEHGRRIAAALAGPTRHVEVAGVGHNDLLTHPAVWREVANFIAGVAKPR